LYQYSACRRGIAFGVPVVPPESCISPEEMFSELESRGSRFELDLTESASV